MDPLFQHNRVVEPLADVEYDDFFAEMGIGKGLQQYERGKKMLSRWEYNWLNHEQAVIELAKWCEV